MPVCCRYITMWTLNSEMGCSKMGTFSIPSCLNARSVQVLQMSPGFNPHNPSISTLITSIINFSLSTGLVHSSLKADIIRPTVGKKTGIDSSDLNSYWPISNLPFISSILEKVVPCQLQICWIWFFFILLDLSAAFNTLILYPISSSWIIWLALKSVALFISGLPTVWQTGHFVQI